MKLKEIRAKYNLSQSQIAEITGLSQKSISNYENNQTFPNVESLIKLSDYFHISVDELIGHNIPYLVNKSLLTDKQNYLINLITDLSDNQCDKVEAYIMGLQMANIEKDITIEKLRRK